jgi:hypothetical protein
MYLGLAASIFVIRPSDDHPFHLYGAVLRLTLVILVFCVGPLLLRTLAFAGLSSGRTVYAYTNPDLSSADFLMQIFNFVIFCFCLALIWTQWSSFAETHRIGLMKEEQGTSINIELANDLSRMLYRWQVTFISFSAGFCIYTAIFWNQIIRHRDWRFCCEAIMAHAFWITTIVITIIPLLDTWRAWNRQKVKAIAALINDTKTSSGDIEARIAAINDLHPIPNWNLTASAAAVVASLIGPCIQALIK